MTDSADPPSDSDATPLNGQERPEMAEMAATDRSATLVAVAILFSRASGLIREAALSYWLGATTIAAEAFAFALGVPKIMQNLLGEGALSASFIPVYSRVVDQSPAAARRLAGAVFGLLASLTAGAVIILMVAADPIVAVLARGANDERSTLIADLVQVMAPGIGFIVFAAWCLGILNSHREFFRSYVAPVLWNAAIVLGLLVWATRSDNPIELAKAGAWGVFIGGVAQFAVQLPRVLAIAGPITPSLRRDEPAVREVIKRFVPGVAGRGVVTLGAFVDLALSSFLAVGAFAVLNKAQTLYLMPIAIFAISIAAADLPELSREADRSTNDAAADRVARSADRVMLFLSFSALAFIIGGRSIVGALFQRGAFSADDTMVVWLTVAVFSFGLVASGLSRLIQNAAFAHGDVAGPARIAVVRLVLSAGIGMTLMWPADRFAIVDGLIQQVETVAFAPLDQAVRDTQSSYRLGSVGLAAGAAVAAWVEFGLLRRRTGALSARLGLGATLVRLIPGLAIAGVVMALLAGLFADLSPLLAAPMIVGPAGVLYLLAASRFGNETSRSLLTSIRRSG